MDREVHPAEPVVELLAVAREVAPDWLRRIVERAGLRGGVDPSGFTAEIERMVEVESARLVGQLDDLLATDVDAQRTNPLSLFRAAIGAPTDLLRSMGVPPPPADRFVAERFPDDVYGIGPATWTDIDPRLHEPGLTWGAWKAMTVLRRRRDEGLR